MEFKIWSCFLVILLVSSCIDGGRVKNAGKVHSRPSSGGSYHPSGGYPSHTATNYHPSQSHNPSYHPPSNTGYHPQPNAGYHPPPNAGYPQPNAGYHPPPNTGYHPAPAQPAQTIIVESEKRGIGTIAKEAAVGAVVSAGVNAAVNRVIPGGIYGHGFSGSSGYAPAPAPAPAAPGVTHTEIVYNNYYGNGTGPAPGDPAAQQPYPQGFQPNPAVPGSVPQPYVPPQNPPNGNYYGNPASSVTYKTSTNAAGSIINNSGLIVTLVTIFIFAKNIF
ncbi:splicing factor 3A subunit 2-like [Microplitis mediator]|uniref:splicing factor 3A subunit 2-like n=1 Tax=Microplitis mediator TaxID=375433 RepID=UPI002555D6B7|nr:splicing factor 3A subunit 2-like [Microplitis mediator]